MTKKKLKIPAINPERLSSIYNTVSNLQKSVSILSNPAAQRRNKLSSSFFAFILTTILIFSHPLLQNYYYFLFDSPKPPITPRVLRSPLNKFFRSESLITSLAQFTPNDNFTYFKHFDDYNPFGKSFNSNNDQGPQNSNIGAPPPSASLMGGRPMPPGLGSPFFHPPSKQGHQQGPPGFNNRRPPPMGRPF
jgi:hypothetical protein